MLPILSLIVIVQVPAETPVTVNDPWLFVTVATDVFDEFWAPPM